MAINYEHPQRQRQRPAAEVAATVPEGWHADPDGVHQYRYHDGRDWTAHVANDGNVTQSPRVPTKIPRLPITLSGRRATLAGGNDAATDNAPIRDQAWVDRLIVDYVEVCRDMMGALESALKVANDVVGARRMTTVRPQHEISIRNFARLSEQREEEWRPLMMTTRDLQARARRIGQELVDTLKPEFEGLDPDVYVFTRVPADVDMLGAAVEFLRIDLSPSSAERFVENIGVANDRVANSPGYGEPGYEGLLYSAHPYLPVAGSRADDKQNKALFLVRALASLTDRSAIGSPFGEGAGLEVARAIARSCMDGRDEMRTAGVRIAVSLLTADSVSPQDVDKVMGMASIDRAGLTTEQARSARDLGGAAVTFLGQLNKDGENIWELWKTNDEVAEEFLCWLAVAWGRLETLGKVSSG